MHNLRGISATAKLDLVVVSRWLSYSGHGAIWLHLHCIMYIAAGIHVYHEHEHECMSLIH